MSRVTGEQVSRAEVLAYRAVAHDLEQPVASPATCGVLDVGVQDTPAGTTAHPALAARSMSPHDEGPTLRRGLVLAHSLRGAMHVHRGGDLGLLATALRPDDAADGDAIDRVAQAMVEVMADDRSRSKGELSTQITPLVRRFLRRCGPAVTADLAAWTGTAPPAARKWWNLLAHRELLLPDPAARRQVWRAALGSHS